MLFFAQPLLGVAQRSRRRASSQGRTNVSRHHTEPHLGVVQSMLGVARATPGDATAAQHNRSCTPACATRAQEWTDILIVVLELYHYRIIAI